MRGVWSALLLLLRARIRFLISTLHQALREMSRSLTLLRCWWMVTPTSPLFPQTRTLCGSVLAWEATPSYKSTGSARSSMSTFVWACYPESTLCVSAIWSSWWRWTLACLASVSLKQLELSGRGNRLNSVTRNTVQRIVPSPLKWKTIHHSGH